MSTHEFLDDAKKQDPPKEPEAPALEAYLVEEAAIAEKPKKKQRRGFAVFDREKHREVSRRGGVAAQASGKAHRFDSVEGKTAGRKGGLAAHPGRAARDVKEDAS